MVVPIEALLGFGLLSASISWLLLIHPAIARRRTLADEIALLRKAEEETDPGRPATGCRGRDSAAPRWYSADGALVSAP